MCEFDEANVSSMQPVTLLLCSVQSDERNSYIKGDLWCLETITCIGAEFVLKNSGQKMCFFP